MLVCCAFCPHPPLLVPDIAGAAAADIAAALAASDRAVAGLLTARPDVVLVLGTGPTARGFGPRSGGTFRGFGAAVTAGLGLQSPEELDLPLSLTVGAWLLRRSGYAGAVRGLTVTGTEDVAALRVLAEQVDPPGERARVAVLAMGDGAACPALVDGDLEPAAAGLDEAVRRALADGDAVALAALDPALGRRVQAAGVAVWRLAGVLFAGAAVRAELGYAGSPFGVAYVVATWCAR